MLLFDFWFCLSYYIFYIIYNLMLWFGFICSFSFILYDYIFVITRIRLNDCIIILCHNFLWLPNSTSFYYWTDYFFGLEPALLYCCIPVEFALFFHFKHWDFM